MATEDKIFIKNAPSWIGGPWIDSIFFSFGWIPIFLAFILAAKWGLKNETWPWLLGFILMVSFIHRHLTFPLVYADPVQFKAHKLVYSLMPFFCLGITLLAIHYTVPGRGVTRPILMALAVAGTLWNIYHTLMQKMGILRIYSRRAGNGRPWLDKTMVFIWFGCLFMFLVASPAIHRQITRYSSSAGLILRLFKPYLPILPYLAVTTLIVAVVVTVLYLRVELAKDNEFHWPKNLFVGSLLLLYGTFYFDFLAGFAAFGFSHAIEYIAFVNVYSKRKYFGQPKGASLLADVLRHQGLWFGLFVFAMVAIFLPWRLLSEGTLAMYILGSSFMHFLYDGWIWKLRRPQVAQPMEFKST